MLPQLTKIIPVILLAQTLIFTGVFFISGQIFPATLGKFYTATGYFSRTMLASLSLFAAANFICGYAMSHFSPSLVSPVMIAGAALLQIVFTIVVIGYKPSLWIIPATLAVMASCIWVSLLLGKN